MDELHFLQEDLLNTDLFVALYVGLVAILFGLKAEAAIDKDVVEMKWRRFTTVICALIAVLLLIRISVTTVLYFIVLAAH